MNKQYKLQKFILCLLLLALSTDWAIAQIGVGTQNPDTSAILDISSSSKGLLMPRMTSAQRLLITNPAIGLTVYNTSTNCLEWYTVAGWKNGCGNPFIFNSSGGTAVVSSYTCNTASAGTMTAGTPVSGVTQTITANVSTIGSYEIYAVANGVIFSASGNFTSTGVQNITLTASGTPTAGGLINFPLTTTPNCTFTRACIGYPAGYVGNNTPIVEVTSPTGRVWMDRNLGASRVATSSTDSLAFGDLFQWGRLADGHQYRNSAIAPLGQYSATDVPGHSMFIQTTSNLSLSDWRSTRNNNLWQGAEGINNPCPTGFQVPTEAEWEAERLSFATRDSSGAFNSVLKLPRARWRTYTGLMGSNQNALDGVYWSSSPDLGSSFARSRMLIIKVDTIQITSDRRVAGFSVRCIKSTGPQITVRPKITATTGQLSVNTGTWDQTPVAYSYQWLKNGVAINGATTSTLSMPISEYGNTFICRVTVQGYFGTTTVSSDTLLVNYVLNRLSYTPPAIYSLRRLTASATNAITVRRSSDNTTQNIGFDAFGNLDTTALKTFVGSDSGYVSVWFDQSGNGRHGANAIAAEQPFIMRGGVIEQINGRPSIRFDGVNDNLVITNGLPSVATPSGIAVLEVIGNGGNGLGRILGTGVAWIANLTQEGYTQFNAYTSDNTTLTKRIVGFNVSGTTADMYRNGVMVRLGTGAVSGNAGGTSMHIGNQTGLNRAYNGKMSEIILPWQTLSNTDRIAIEQNQGAYFNITVQ